MSDTLPPDPLEQAEVEAFEREAREHEGDARLSRLRRVLYPGASDVVRAPPEKADPS
jgi:hypothetical protein